MGARAGPTNAATGETTMTFKLMHGAIGSGHADFTAEPIAVEVVDDGG